jgi:hypothetical protein
LSKIYIIIPFYVIDLPCFKELVMIIEKTNGNLSEIFIKNVNNAGAEI